MLARALTLVVQSATVSPDEVERRIDGFLAKFREALAAASASDVAGLAEQLAGQYKEPGSDGRLDSQASRLWAECELRRYDWERPWANAAAAKRVTAEALLGMFDSFIGVLAQRDAVST